MHSSLPIINNLENDNHVKQPDRLNTNFSKSIYGLEPNFRRNLFKPTSGNIIYFNYVIKNLVVVVGVIHLTNFKKYKINY